MRVLQVVSMLVVCLAGGFVAAQQTSGHASLATGSVTELGPYVAIAAPAQPGSFDEVVERTVQREHEVVAHLSALRPMVETYAQSMKADAGGSATPVQDQYFLLRLDLGGPGGVAFLAQIDSGRKRQDKIMNTFAQPLQSAGIARMLVLDAALYKKDYDFTFVRREFLGEVRCIVMDVQPRADTPPGRFAGRIWVEDQDYTIVRFNGTYSGHAGNSPYVHFDSWRLNLQPGVWLPAYIYSEESDSAKDWGKVHLKVQTRLWGYDLSAAARAPTRNLRALQSTAVKLKTKAPRQPTLHRLWLSACGSIKPKTTPLNVSRRLPCWLQAAMWIRCCRPSLTISSSATI
jgi:hypothetical protein